MSSHHYDWPKKISARIESGIPFVVVTLAEVKGSAPQNVGAKAIVTKEGVSDGTVGGGKLEAKAIAHAQSLLSQPNSLRCELVQWNLIRDVGMTCGGVVQMMFEVYGSSSWEIVVFGAGHVAQELVPLLARMDCRVTCVDDREEWLDKLPERGNLRRLRLSEPKSFVAECSTQSYFLLMTRGHATDVPILAEILRGFDPPYVGTIGSKSKAVVLRQDLRKLGLSEEKVNSFYSPMGLPIGDNSPIEIAISIAAQLLEVRGAKSGTSS